LEKSAAKQMKDKLKRRKDQIAAQEKWYSLYKSIGDGTAFTFIDRFDLKPQFFKPSPGFISGKKGTRLERYCLRAAFRHDSIAIMNDLTHVMKYADITIVFEKNIWRLVEVKSGRRKNARDQRQNEMSNKMLEYVLKDTPADLYNLGAPMIRVAQVHKWKTHEKIMHTIFSEAKEKGFCLHKMRPGYYVAAEYGHDKTYFDEFIQRMRLKKPMMLFQNEDEFKYQAIGLTPYCITFLDPDQYIDFLVGKLRIIHFVDIDKIAAYCERRGYRLFVLDDPNYIFEVQQIADNTIRCRISRHYFLRIFLEFVHGKYLGGHDGIAREWISDGRGVRPDAIRNVG
jgi:hypothetical protein